jgi:hypothetical protein
MVHNDVSRGRSSRQLSLDAILEKLGVVHVDAAACGCNPFQRAAEFWHSCRLSDV